MNQPKCPECEKLVAVAPKSQAVGEFLEWLISEKEIFLCKQTESWEEYGDQFVVIRENREKLLAEFFDIDLVVVEKERQALLDYIRNGNEN